MPAYERGGSGAGVIIGIVDTGIDVNNIEFAGRIDSRSADLVRPGVVPSSELRPGGPTLQAVDGHGTSVAGILAAAKNDLGMHGVAFNATLLVYRGDKEGDSGTIFGEAIEEGVRRAAANGAKVLNFSLGSNEPGVRSDFNFYFNLASSNNIIVATSAGNDSNPNPDESALAAIDPSARGSVIIVGSVDATNTISSFSNRAGSGANVFLVAPGELIRTPALGGSSGSTVLFSGTSAATPFVTGAAALIRQLWPTLTAAEVADILLTSATDLGAPGVDAIYGHGLLNVGAAIAPLGATTTSSVSGLTLAPNTGSFSPGPAFGSSVPDFGDFVFLDSYGRDFSGDLNAFAAGPLDLRADPVAFLRPFSEIAYAATPIGGGSAAFQMQTDDRALIDPQAALRAPASGPGDDDGEPTQRLRASFSQPLSASVEYRVGFGFAPRAFDQTLGGGAPQSLARDAFSDAYLPAAGGGFVNALRWRLGDGLEADLLLSQASGAAYPSSDGFAYTDAAAPGDAQSNIRLGLSRRFSGGALRLESGLARERGRVLGAAFGGLFGDSADSTTYYQTLSFDAGLAGGWRALARGAIGLTRSDASGRDGFFGGVSDLVTTQFALGVYKSDFLTPGGRLTLSASQPLRIEAGGAYLVVPARYDYEAGAFEFVDRFAPLGPGAREVDLEVGYAAATPFGTLELNVLRQFNAGGGAEDATTGILRTRISF